VQTKKRILWFLLCLCLLGNGHRTQCQPPASQTELTDEDRREQAVRAAYDYHKVAGGQAFLVMQDGRIIFEAYDNGGGEFQPQMLASGSKSFVGIVAIAAVQDGLLSLDERACETLQEWTSDTLKSQITLRQLLTLSSGLTPGEIGTLGQSQPWKEILAVPMVKPPGTSFDYGPNHLCVFGEILQRKLRARNDESFEAYLNRRILRPIGARVVWRQSSDGNPRLGGGAWMTARDWADFGWLICQEGRWGQRQLLDPGLLQDCFQSSTTNPAYGLTWWLKKKVDPLLLRSIPILMRDMGDIVNAEWLPDDLRLAAGAGKQRLYVIPSLKMVIARLGPLTAQSPFRDADFLSLLLRGGTPEEYEARAGGLIQARPLWPAAR